MPIELDDITSGYNISKINNNFQRVETYINDKLLARAQTGIAGEAKMERDLDMDGYSILNANIDGSSITNDRAIRVTDLSSIPPIPQNDEERRGKVISFDINTGFPIAIAPASGSAVDVLNQIADPSLGDALIGVKSALLNSTPRTQHSKNADVVSIKDFGAVGDGVVDDTVSIQAALDSGKSVVIPDGDFIVSALTLATNDVTLSGTGRLVKKADINGRLLSITGTGCTVKGLRFNGRNPAPNQMHFNDIIHVTGSRTTIDSNFIDGSQGGGITIMASSDNKIVNNTILDTVDNNIIIADEGANNNVVSGNICIGTVNQNNIFVTASPDSTANGKLVYNNIVTNNYCADSGDTGIEAGYHTTRTVISNNICINSKNPGILLRDNFGTVVNSNIVIAKAVEDQVENYDGIALVPQNEGVGNYSAQITNNIIIGATKRSAIYAGGSFVEINGNTIFDNSTTITSAGVGLLGSGVLVVNGTNDISIRDNCIRRKLTAFSLQYTGATTTIQRCTIRSNKALEIGTFLDGRSLIFDQCSVSNNDISIVKSAVLDLTGATLAGGLKYLDNSVSMSGFVGAAPSEIYPNTIIQSSCLITDSKTKVYTLPSTQGGLLTISRAGENFMGICVVQFADGTASAIYSVGGKPGSGSGVVTKMNGTSNTYGTEGATTYDGWTLYYDSASNDLVFQKRDSSVDPVGRLARVALFSL